MALDEFLDDENLPAVVRHAALRGMIMLNKYYALTDDSIVYRLAMMLHPAYKTTYFRKAKWQDDWVLEAERLIRNEWVRNYKPSAVVSRPVAGGANVTGAEKRFSAAKKYFAVLDEQAASGGDALDEWLSSPVVPSSLDPIAYWTAMLKGGNSLARMALDFLSIPASSTDVERAFSSGGLTVSKLRHSLSDESTRAASILGSWFGLEGVIPHHELTQLFKDKKRRPKKKPKIATGVRAGSSSQAAEIDTAANVIDITMYSPT